MVTKKRKITGMKPVRAVCACMLAACITSSLPVAAHADTISELEKQIGESESDLSKTEQKIADLEAEIADRQDQVTELNGEIDEELLKKADEYEDLSSMIRLFYERYSGRNVIIECLASSGSIAEAFRQMENMQTMTETYTERQEEYQETVDSIRDDMEKLEDGIAELEDLKAEKETLKESLSKTIEEKKTELEEAEAALNTPSGTCITTGNGCWEYSESDLELIYAIVAQECNVSYEGALAVITCACNRTASSRWSYLGSDPLSQLTAKGQFCYSLDSYWKKYLGGNVPDYVKQAVNDALDGVRTHNFLSFRANSGSGRTEIGDNWYFSEM